jgi:hypothetical protein
MKNITLSAEESLIRKAREKARSEHRSFNDAFRAWLVEWTRGDDRLARYDELIARLAPRVDSGGPFSREELNER